MSAIRFTCTRLNGTGKAGILKPDADGYYDMVIGGLNILNSAGQYYVYEGAKALFEDSSQLMRRIKRGALRGELEHPKQLPGMSDDDYIQRIMTIDNRNTCVHFSEIYLDFKNFKDERGTPIIAIMGKLTPSGPHAPTLKLALENPKENACFSIRAFTKDTYAGGQYLRELKNIITFDYVNEPGIHIAEKYNSPCLESLVDKPMTQGQLERALTTKVSPIAQESFAMTPAELFHSFGWSLDTAKKPSYQGW